MLYSRLNDGLLKYKLIPASEDVWKHITSNETDWYVSLFEYNDEHFKQWKEKGTVAGIKDPTTRRLFFDFDNAKNPEVARQDAITLVTRLLSKGVPSKNIQVAFSGSKGFSVEVEGTTSITPAEFKNVTTALAGDLSTFDKVVSDPQRITRVVGTKHPKSKLYKFPLSVDQLSELDINTIKELAKDIDNIDSDLMEGWHEVVLPDSITSLRIAPKMPEKEQIETADLDLGLKPKWLSEAKFALQEGFFGAGERNTAFMVLAATYRNQGFNKEIVYRMLKGVAEVQAQRNHQDRYSDDELWKNIIETVMNPNWKGGQYSYENTPLLRDVTQRLKLKLPKTEDNPVVPLGNVTDIFRKFAVDIEANTIKLGIKRIDDEIKVTTSMLVGLVAPPGAGKTSLSMDILNNTSKNNINAMFFSMDMGAPLIFQRLLQKHSGISSKKIFEMYQTEDARLGELEERLNKEYANVSFCFRSGLTVEDMRELTLKQQEDSGKKIKLIVVDYLECISTQFSDSTASSAYIVQKLKDIANELECTVLLLLQPQKIAGDPSEEILSYIRIKGSSAIQQACSVIFSMSRPGFSPKKPEQDKFASIAVIKNRMGTLAQYDFHWHGLTGEIRELEDEEMEELNELRARKQAEKTSQEI